MEVRRQEQDDVVEVAVVPEPGVAGIDRASVRERHQDDQDGPEDARENLHGGARYSSAGMFSNPWRAPAPPSLPSGFLLKGGGGRAGHASPDGGGLGGGGEVNGPAAWRGPRVRGPPAPRG